MQLERLFHLGSEQAVSAQDIFTNRHTELHAFETALQQVREQRRQHPDLVADLTHARRNVLVYYGMGGIGKTTLSKELQRRFDEGALDVTEARLSARIDFAELAALDLEATLLHIRACLGGLGGGWPAFDLALAAYWERKHPGEPMKDFIERHSTLGRFASGIGLSDQVQEALDSVLGGAGLVGTAWRAGGLVKSEILRRLAEGRLLRDCPYFGPLVTEASPEKSRLFLPVLLAWDLAAKQRRDDLDVTIFLDTWEVVQASPDDAEGVEDALTRLIYLMPNVLFVVTGRSQVTWADETRRVSLKYAGPMRWPDLVVDRANQQILVGSLSAEDCDRYLSERLVLNGGPAIPREIRQRIIDGSEGLPLYLDLSADHYDELLMQGKPDPREFGGPLPHLVTRVIRDLGEAERQFLRAAAMVVAFDKDLLAAAVPNVRDAALERFLLRHFVCGGRQGWLQHSLHDTLRSSIRTYDRVSGEPWSAGEWRSAGTRILEFLGHRADTELDSGSPPDRNLLIECFLQGFMLCAEFELAPDWLLRVGSALSDLGQYQVLNQLSTFDWQTSQPAAPLALGSLAMLRRHCGTLVEAQELLERALLNQDIAQYPQQRLALELAEILVRRNLDDEAENLLIEIALGEGRLARRSSEWLAILDLRRGKFTRVIRWMQEPKVTLQEQARADDLLAWVYFANGRFEECEQSLRTALEGARRSALAPLEAWIYEHLAWVTAWSRPAEASAMAEKALQLAEQLETPIEIGRALATRAVARIGERGPVEILPDIERSLGLIERSGFRSDALNPLMAKLFLHCVDGDVDAARAVRDQIVRLTEELGVHQETGVIGAWWIEELTRRREADREPVIDWLDGRDQVMGRWKAVLTSRRHHRTVEGDLAPDDRR